VHIRPATPADSGVLRDIVQRGYGTSTRASGARCSPTPSASRVARGLREVRLYTHAAMRRNLEIYARLGYATSDAGDAMTQDASDPPPAE
jgi:hypothetical protein